MIWNMKKIFQILMKRCFQQKIIMHDPKGTKNKSFYFENG
jgi:hypothetical protein